MVPLEDGGTCHYDPCSPDAHHPFGNCFLRLGIHGAMSVCFTEEVCELRWVLFFFNDKTTYVD